MKSGTPLVNDVKRLAQLREIRQEAARRDCDAKRALRDAAVAVLTASRDRLDTLRRQRKELTGWAFGEGANSKAWLHSFAVSRGEALDAACERAHYDVLDEELAFDRAVRAFSEAHQLWLTAQARTQAVDNLLSRTVASLGRDAEARAERDTDSAGRTLSAEVGS